MNKISYVLTFTRPDGYKCVLGNYTDIALARKAKAQASVQLGEELMAKCALFITVTDVDSLSFDVREWL